MLAYFPADDSYELVVRWPDDLRVRVTTTIQCRRPAEACLESDGPSPMCHWETISVTHALHRRIWVDPVFLGRPRSFSRLPAKHQDAVTEIGSRVGETLELIVTVSAGFYQETVYEGPIRVQLASPVRIEDDFRTLQALDHERPLSET